MHAGRVTADGAVYQSVAGKPDPGHQGSSSDLGSQDRPCRIRIDCFEVHMGGVGAPKARCPGQQHIMPVYVWQRAKSLTRPPGRRILVTLVLVLKVVVLLLFE